MKKTKSFTVNFIDPQGNTVTSEFVLRKPTIQDRIRINQLKKTFNQDYNDIEAENIALILATISVLGEKIPSWYSIQDLDETFLKVLTDLYYRFIAWRDEESYRIIPETEIKNDNQQKI